MPLLLPPWRCRADAELRAIVREAWEGRVVGSSQLEGAAGLRHCPLAGCPTVGRGEDLVPPATLRAIPTTFVLGPGFVYWIEGDDVLAIARP